MSPIKVNLIQTPCGGKIHPLNLDIYNISFIKNNGKELYSFESGQLEGPEFI
jgi:hypothetical protein